jgi:hypothetical protein
MRNFSHLISTAVLLSFGTAFAAERGVVEGGVSNNGEEMLQLPSGPDEEGQKWGSSLTSA